MAALASPPVAVDGRALAGRIAIVAAPTDQATEAMALLVADYGNADLDAAQVVVALGGDGLMLETQHRLLGRNLPV